MCIKYNVSGSEQECPEDFGSNDDSTCFLMKDGEWICPEGYHNEDGDEIGQCDQMMKDV